MHRSSMRLFAVASVLLTLVMLFTACGSNGTPVLCTVRYDGNGHSAGDPPADSHRYVQGEMVTVLANTGGLSRTGYDFAGWGTLADGSGQNYDAGDSFAMGDADVTLYALWTDDPAASEYSVDYDGNGNTDGDPPVDPAAYAQGETVTVLGNTAGLEKTGFEFIGWTTNPDGSGASYDPDETFLMGTSDVELFAAWSEPSDLSLLSLSVGALDPVFDPAEFEYAIDLANPYDLTTTLTATVSSATDSLEARINEGAWFDCASGVASSEMFLPVGQSIVEVRVTSSDDVSSTYEITLDRNNYFQADVQTAAIAAADWLCDNTSTGSGESWFDSDYACWQDSSADAHAGTTAMCLSSILSTRHGWDSDSAVRGYADLDAATQSVVTRAMRYLIRKTPAASATAQVTWYASAARAMALYMATGGPDSIGEATTVRSTYDTYISTLELMQDASGCWEDTSATDSMHLTYLAAAALWTSVNYGNNIAAALARVDAYVAASEIASTGSYGLYQGGGAHLNATAEALGLYRMTGRSQTDSAVQRALGWLAGNYSSFEYAGSDLWAPFSNAEFVHSMYAGLVTVIDDPGGAMDYAATIGTGSYRDAAADGHPDCSTGVDLDQTGQRWLYDYQYYFLQYAGAGGEITPPSTASSDAFLDHVAASLVLSKSTGMFDVDIDGDGVIVSDNAPFASNSTQFDADADGVGDVVDNAPSANPDQLDSDGDGTGDVDDPII